MYIYLLYIIFFELFIYTYKTELNFEHTIVHLQVREFNVDLCEYQCS